MGNLLKEQIGPFFTLYLLSEICQVWKRFVAESQPSLPFPSGFKSGVFFSYKIVQF